MLIKSLSFWSYKNNHSHDVWQRSLMNITEERNAKWSGWMLRLFKFSSKSVSRIYKKKRASHIIFIGFWRENKNSSEPFSATDSHAQKCTCADGELSPSSPLIRRALRQNVQKLCVILNSAGPQHKQARLLSLIPLQPASALHHEQARSWRDKQDWQTKKPQTHTHTHTALLLPFSLFLHTHRKKKPSRQGTD